MYFLIKLNDPETDFVDYLVTKDLQKSLEYLSNVQMSESSKYGNSITSYLKNNRKKFYDLSREEIFQNECLEQVNAFLFNLKNKKENKTKFDDVYYTQIEPDEEDRAKWKIEREKEKEKVEEEIINQEVVAEVGVEDENINEEITDTTIQQSPSRKNSSSKRISSNKKK